MRFVIALIGLPVGQFSLGDRLQRPMKQMKMGHHSIAKEMRIGWMAFTIMTAAIGYGQSLQPYEQVGLALRIVVRYPEAQLVKRQPSLATDLLVVGSGLGLSWDVPTKLTKTAEPDTWAIQFSFNGTANGYRCSTCSETQLVPIGAKFQFRVMTSDSTDMIGPNYALSLHISQLETSNFPVRELTVHPHFFTRQGTVRSVTVASGSPLIGSRLWNYYLPPSFAENPFKTYPATIVMDLNGKTMETFGALLDEIYSTDAVAQESVVIGSHDYFVEGTLDGRSVLLTPTPGINWACVDGSFINNCGGCIPSNATNRQYAEYMRDGCGMPSVTGGQGEAYLDHMVGEVLPAVVRATADRLLTDRDHVTVSGCSLGGLLACHAAWTRPQTFGAAACQSSSFWWPAQVNAENGFYFLNHTLRLASLHGSRPPQKLYIDVSQLEDEEYYAQLDAALSVAKTIVTNSPQLRPDETIWFKLGNGQVHGNDECFSRTWMYLSLLHKPSGDASNPNVKRIDCNL